MFLFLLAFPALAAETAWQDNDRVAVRIISATQNVAEDTLTLGLDVQLKGNWHSYWRSPGQSGLPPQIDWQGSQNVQSIDILYPWPERKTILGIENFLYEKAVVYPLMLQVNNSAEPVQLHLKLALLTCAEICVPNDFVFQLTLPAGPPAESAHAPTLKNALARVPPTENNTAIDLDITRASLSPSLPGLVLAVAGKNIPPTLQALVETPLALSFNPAQVITTTADSATVHLTLTDAAELQSLQKTTEATITLYGSEAETFRAREQQVAVGAADPSVSSAPLPETSAPTPFILILVFAFLGGLILNVMPCVLPVISLKILSIVKHSDYGPAVIRRSFLITAAGIVASFLVLAAAMIVVRQLGHTVGWGIQFQEPVFIAALAVLISLFAANMFGLLHMGLPQNLEQKLSDSSQGKSNLAYFLQGAFATLMATPCSAPFLGTAASFALVASIPHILLIFICMGVGLATPYVLLAWQPQWLRFLPKPGQWMGVLRIILGVALLATVAWLVFVLSGQVDEMFWQGLAACLVVVWLLLMLRKKLPPLFATLAGVMAGLVCAAALVMTAYAPVPTSHLATSSVGTPSGALVWQVFDEQDIATLVGQGKTVFVDVTARWCLTCLYNKRTVLENEVVSAALSQPPVVLMKADWTMPSPAIAGYLRRHGRAGIPFNIVYGPAAPQGVPLPELLTNGAVLQALEQAQKQP